MKIPENDLSGSNRTKGSPVVIMITDWTLKQYCNETARHTIYDHGYASTTRTNCPTQTYKNDQSPYLTSPLVTDKSFFSLSWGFPYWGGIVFCFVQVLPKIHEIWLKAMSC